MKSTNVLTSIAAACLASGAHGLTTPKRLAETPVEGYGVVELTWEVETTPGGPKAILNGTIEEVHAQLLEINPRYDEEFAPIIAERAAASTEQQKNTRDLTSGSPDSSSSSHLQKRDWTICASLSSFPNDWAYVSAIQTGISYLRGLSGQALNGPGPRNCGRVSCSENSGIWYCNNNSYSKSMPWFHVANAAQVLVNDCSRSHSINGLRTKGERWHDDGWFAIVAAASC